MKISVIKLIILAIIVGAILEGISIYHSLNYWRPQQHSSAAPTSNSAQPFLQLSLPDLTNHLQSFSQWKGKTLVINFWATWCEPCKEEMPLLNQLQNQFNDKGIQFVGIGVDENKELSNWLKERPSTYPILVGTDQILELTKAVGNQQQGIPFTIIISPKGEIKYTKLGKLDAIEVRQLLSNNL